MPNIDENYEEDFVEDEEGSISVAVFDFVTFLYLIILSVLNNQYCNFL